MATWKQFRQAWMDLYGGDIAGLSYFWKNYKDMTSGKFILTGNPTNYFSSLQFIYEFMEDDDGDLLKYLEERTPDPLPKPSREKLLKKYSSEMWNDITITGLHNFTLEDLGEIS